MKGSDQPSHAKRLSYCGEWRCVIQSQLSTTVLFQYLCLDAFPKALYGYLEAIFSLNLSVQLLDSQISRD